MSAMWKKFKKWFSKSGINYKLIPQGHSLYRMFQNQQMIDGFPFDHLIEAENYPFTKVYRSNLKTKLVDTWTAIIGNHYDIYIEGKGQKGLLDLLIFPLLSRRLTAYAYDRGNNQWLRYLAGFIALPLEIARVVSAYALTLGLSPITLFVHLITRPQAKMYQNEMANLIIQFDDKEDTLQNYMFSDYFLTIWRKKDKLSLEIDLDNPYANDISKNRIGTIPLDKRNYKALDALLALNTNNIHKKLQSQKIQPNEIIDITTKEIKRQIIFSASLKRYKSVPLNQFVNNPIFDQNLMGIIFNYSGDARNIEQSLGVKLLAKASNQRKPKLR